jgi:hypothetical protein
VIRRTIADGVNQKLIAYAGKVGGDRYDPLIFEPDTGPIEADIELSDEMVIVRAEDARLLKEPSRLTRIEVRPESAKARPGEAIAFTASCIDQHDRAMSEAVISWSSSGGTIDGQGRFIAESKGDYRIQAMAGSLTETAEVRVEERIIDPVPPPKSLGWKGTVPPQKWMNFYTKVLSSLVATPGLRLEVRFELPAGDAVNETKIEATKAALRELGLSEEVEVR